MPKIKRYSMIICTSENNELSGKPSVYEDTETAVEKMKGLYNRCSFFNPCDHVVHDDLDGDIVQFTTSAGFTYALYKDQEFAQ